MPLDFDALYEEWKDPVYRYLVHYVGSVSMAEDLFQEVWLKAFEQLGQLRDPGAFRPWIFRIARNMALNNIRKDRRKTQIWILSDLSRAGRGEEEAGLLSRLADKGSTPADIAIGKERKRLLRESLQDLDPLTQEIFQLRYFEHLSLREIAEILQIPLGTVGTRIYRGLDQLRVALEQNGLQH